MIRLSVLTESSPLLIPCQLITFANVGHFGHGHFGLGRFGPDISATDVSASENAKGGRFGHNHKLWVGVCACINV